MCEADCSSAGSTTVGGVSTATGVATARRLDTARDLAASGVLTLAHSRHDLDSQSRWANAMRFNGIDAELLDAAQVREREPRLNFGADARFPILGGFVQPRAGTIRHDAVAWGYARAASALGVDIVQNCTVTDVLKSDGRVVGVRTTRGEIRGPSTVGDALLEDVELAELLEVGQMTLARLLDELASAGLVERRTDPNDGRVNQMFLSAEGLRQIRTVEKVADVVRIRAMQGLNEEQINGAYKALRSMRDNLASTASLFDNTESSAKRKKRAARILPGTILATSKEKSLRMGRDGATRTPRR